MGDGKIIETTTVGGRSGELAAYTPKIKWKKTKRLFCGLSGTVGHHYLFSISFDLSRPKGTKKRYRVDSCLPKLGLQARVRYFETVEDAQECCQLLFDKWFKSLIAKESGGDIL